MSKKKHDWQALYAATTQKPVSDTDNDGYHHFTPDYVAWLEDRLRDVAAERLSALGRIEKAIQLGFRYGKIDGDHHKMWVIDQMLRKLVGKSYRRMVKEYENGEDGPKTYEWDEGRAP